MHLTKHHGLGNDFLILFAGSAAAGLDGPALARRLCERRRGLGADGLIVATDGGPDGADLTMVLFNADGSRAETSGNGLRCLAQAETRRRGLSSVDLRIATDAGVRACEVGPGSAPGTAEVSVAMGKVVPGPEPAPDLAVAGDPDSGFEDRPRLGLDATRWLTVDVGNPHWVLEVPDPQVVDLVAAGPLHEAAFPEGINVHFMAPTAGQADTVTITTWERGAGVTEACGSGACAAAAVAARWGLVASPVTVHMPGGSAHVLLDGDEATLVGPAAFVAGVDVEP